MSFRLQAVDPGGSERDEHMSLSRRAMADLRMVMAGPDQADDTPVAKLLFNDGQRVSPDECDWLATRLRTVDRQRIIQREPGPDELLELVDQLADFFELCATVGGFEVW